jgi:hypothetical protein
MNLASALNREGKGFHLVDALSAADPASVKVFPDNIEMEAVQTFASDTPGKEAGLIAADPRQISFTVHHSLIRLPAPGFQVRKFDIRSGSHATLVYDFGTPLGQDVALQLANHFRLDKVDPNAARSRVKKPIIFYIDTAAPEPLRTALQRASHGGTMPSARQAISMRFRRKSCPRCGSAGCALFHRQLG